MWAKHLARGSPAVGIAWCPEQGCCVGEFDKKLLRKRYAEGALNVEILA